MPEPLLSILGLLVIIAQFFFISAQYRLFAIAKETAELNAELKTHLANMAADLSRIAEASRKTAAASPTASELAMQKIIRGQTGTRRRECPGCRAILDVPTAGAHNCPECGCAL